MIQQHKIQRYGWRPSYGDSRDYLFRVDAPIELPPIVDLRDKCPAVYDQGELGSCTANALAGAIEFDQMKQGITDFMPSRLFVYYNEREIEGTTKSDAGAMIRDGIQSLNKQGVCPETEWPYNINMFDVKPNPKCYTDAIKSIIKIYQKIPDGNLFLMKQCLAKGFPFVFGFTVYDSFESQEVADTGMMPESYNSGNVIGGHAVMAVGYNDEMKRLIVRNSWSENWGDKGYFYMPYSYASNPNLVQDNWVINQL